MIRNCLTFIAFGAMIATAVAYVGSLGVRIGPPSDRTTISMQVADVNGLVLDSNVLLRGVPVGKVTGIESSVSGATVDFYIDGRYRVPVDSDVRLENLSALGETYIGLVPRRDGGQTMYSGMHLTTEQVTQPASISELATSVVRLLNQADPVALKRIVNEADTALPDPNTVLPNLSRTAVLFRNMVSDMNGRGRDLLDNFQTLVRNAGWVGPVIADMAPGIGQTGYNVGQTISSARLTTVQGAPGILRDFSKFLDRIQRLLDNNAGDLRIVGEAMLPHLKGVAGALLNFDTGQILSNVLATVPQDGAVTLHVAVPPTG
jgi:phospholipid/cholesterol/gamma-HCH transport system substrate-binding protein